MRLAAVFFAFACVSAFAQDNVAAESAKKRIGALDLLNPHRPLLMSRLTPGPPMNLPAPGYCAIPLINVVPPGAAARSRMPILPPHDVGDRMEVRVPAPACAPVR